MTTTTPGPWRLIDAETLEDGSVYPAHIVGGARDLEICHLWRDNTARDELAESATDIRSKRANARLIAAAPDLLDALKALTVWSADGEQLCFRSPHSVPMGMSTKQARLARAALAKAEGR